MIIDILDSNKSVFSETKRVVFQVGFGRQTARQCGLVADAVSESCSTISWLLIIICNASYIGVLTVIQMIGKTQILEKLAINQV